MYHRELITYYLMGIGGMTVCCLGLIGNMLSLVVLTHRSMRSSTYSYLSALCICDSLGLIFTVVILVKDLRTPVLGKPPWPWYEGIYPYLFPYVHPAVYTLQVTSIWLTLAFTVDRYIMICHPFKAEPFCTVSRARKVIVGLGIGSVLFNIPKFFEYETLTIPYGNSTKIGCDLTDFGENEIFRRTYHSYFYIIFICGIPFLTLAVLNSFLMHAVRLSRQKGREINVVERKRMDTTVMLIGVVVVFFICQMPALVSRVIWAFEEDTKSHSQMLLFALNEIGNFMIVLNSAINIVPYYFFGKKFRHHFWLVFCQCLLKYDRFRSLTHTNSMTVIEPDRRISNGSYRAGQVDFNRQRSSNSTQYQSEMWYSNHGNQGTGLQLDMPISEPICTESSLILEKKEPKDVNASQTNGRVDRTHGLLLGKEDTKPSR